MQIADFNHNDFTRAGASEADKSLLVKFFVKARPDSEKTLSEGRPVFKDVEYVDIKIPGNRNAGACRPATEDDKKRFPAHYRAFKDRVNDEPMEGTPLTEWNLITRSLAEELAFCHVKTVEQLATMSDAQASRFMGLMPLKERAKLWLENSKKEKPMWEMDQKIRRQAEEIEQLKSAVTRLLETEGISPDDTTNARQVVRAKKEALENAKKLAV
jgi:hypothetical protein